MRRMGAPGPEPELDPDADPHAVARLILLRRLAAAPRSRRQLEQDLADRGVPAEIGAQALDRFAELGYVDDEAFARGWVNGRHRSRALARTAIRRELSQRGIDEAVAEVALAEISDEQERARGQEFARRRLERMGRVEDAVAFRRLVGALMRRGFSWAAAASVAREVLDQRT